MRRRANKRDANHGPIRDRLKCIPGCYVKDTGDYGDGFPDLVVRFRGKWCGLEIKDPAKPPSARSLRSKQEEWQWIMGEQYRCVTTFEEACDAIGVRLA